MYLSIIMCVSIRRPRASDEIAQTDTPHLRVRMVCRYCRVYRAITFREQQGIWHNNVRRRLRMLRIWSNGKHEKRLVIFLGGPVQVCL